MPFTIYLDLECMLKKITTYSKQPRKILYRQKAKHQPSGWSMFIQCSFDEKENKFKYYRGKDCIVNLCKELKECKMEITNRDKKEMVPLTHEKDNFYNKQKMLYMQRKVLYR